MLLGLCVYMQNVSAPELCSSQSGYQHALLKRMCCQQVQWQQSELKYSATCTTHPANNTTEIVIITVCVGILVLCLLGSCITFVWWKFSVANELRRLGANASKRKHPPGCCPGHEDAEVTLVHTDIEGSTDIWEW